MAIPERPDIARIMVDKVCNYVLALEAEAKDQAERLAKVREAADSLLSALDNSEKAKPFMADIGFGPLCLVDAVWYLSGKLKEALAACEAPGW